MAVLFSCGFEAGLDAYYLQRGWSFVAGTTITSTTANLHRSLNGNGGDYGMHVDDDCTSPYLGTTNGRWLHFAYHPETTASQCFVQYYRNGVAQFFVLLSNTGAVILRLGGSAAPIVASSTTGWRPYCNHWIAIYLVAANSGSCEVWVDGVQIVTYSGDTQNATEADWDQFGFDSANLIGTIDDIIITDATTGRLAEKFIPALRPTSDDSVQFSPGTNNYSYVDEVPVSTSDYVSTTTAGQQDTYNMGDLAWSPPVGTISHVTVNAYAERQGAIIKGIPICKSNVTTSEGATTYLPAASWGIADAIWSTDPDTSSAWTESGVNAMKAGLKFAS